jgi:hypothetical protein
MEYMRYQATVQLPLHVSVVALPTHLTLCYVYMQLYSNALLMRSAGEQQFHGRLIVPLTP